MLIWLDNVPNVAGHPNENFARELMELFTLGVGNYTEEDINEIARAFHRLDDRREPVPIRLRCHVHDDGLKGFLGAGYYTGDDIIAILAARPRPRPS